MAGIGHTAIQVTRNTQDVEFQSLRIPYIQEIRSLSVHMESDIVGVNQGKNRIT